MNNNDFFKEIYKDYNWDLLFGPFNFKDNKLTYNETFYFVIKPIRTEQKQTLILELD